MRTPSRGRRFRLRQGAPRHPSPAEAGTINHPVTTITAARAMAMAVWPMATRGGWRTPGVRHEAPRVHHAAPRRGHGISYRAACGTGAAGQKAGEDRSATVRLTIQWV